ncbi:MAG: DUF6491 family protein [Bdellovibrionota bacterium]
MKLIKALALSLIATSALGSTALAECFHSRSASGFEVTSNDTIQVRVGARQYYDMKFRHCSSLRWAHQIAFRSHSSWVCDGDTVILMDAWGSEIDRCWIDELTKVQN